MKNQNWSEQGQAPEEWPLRLSCMCVWKHTYTSRMWTWKHIHIMYVPMKKHINICICTWQHTYTAHKEESSHTLCLLPVHGHLLFNLCVTVRCEHKLLKKSCVWLWTRLLEGVLCLKRLKDRLLWRDYAHYSFLNIFIIRCSIPSCILNDKRNASLGFDEVTDEHRMHFYWPCLFVITICFKLMLERFKFFTLSLQTRTYILLFSIIWVKQSF